MTAEMDLASLRALVSQKEREAEQNLVAAILAQVNGSDVPLLTIERALRAVIDQVAGADPAAKYVDPRNRKKTWTGRGRKPNWLRDIERAGGKKEDCKVVKFNEWNSEK